MNTTIMTYEEWKKANPDIKGPQVNCEQCETTGLIDRGRDGKGHVCPDCKGSGKTNSAFKMYEAQKRKDISRLINLYGREAVDKMFADGV